MRVSYVMVVHANDVADYRTETNVEGMRRVSAN